MQFFTCKNKLETNTELLLKLNVPVNTCYIDVVCSSYYTIFVNGDVEDFGPCRTASGYARIKRFIVPPFKNIEMKIIYYGVDTFEFSDTDFYFGLDYLDNDENIINVDKQFDVFINRYHENISCKFSYQRGLVERYDLSKKELQQFDVIKIDSPVTILSKEKPNCIFEEVNPNFVNKSIFNGFDRVNNPYFMKYEMFKKVNKYDLQEVFKNCIDEKYESTRFDFDKEYTGLLKIKVNAKTSNKKVLICFDEILINDEWFYGRNNTNDVIEITTDPGEFEIITNVPYSFMHLMVIKTSDDEVEVSAIKVQNDYVINTKSTGDKDVDLVIESAKRSFQQNAYDVFTDCPSRERAGWLCDSYFTGIAEKFYKGDNKMERNFIENVLLSSRTDLPEGMFPMCYPSYHINHNFIPNWSLWLVVEIVRYYKENKDEKLLKLSKERVYKLFDYFKKFENEYGLLENLEAWVFVEWSKANDEAYIKGVNFPTNMLYADTLVQAGELYGDETLINKGNSLKKVIVNLSYNGEYFVDNAIRNNDALDVCKEHTTETCQYYALFFNVFENEEFLNRMLNKNIDSKLSKSAPFIGKTLRLILLKNNKKYDQILEEFVPYYLLMAKVTNTLWEMVESDNASCNHGFSSIVGPIVYEAYRKANYKTI